MKDITILWISLAAFGGGILAGYLGYLKSGNAWSWKIFQQSLITGLISGFVFGVGYIFTSEGLTIRDLVIAVLAGAGVDNLTNRVLK